MLNTSPSDLAGAAAGGQFHSTQPSVVRRRSFDDAEAARKVADATAGQTSEVRYHTPKCKRNKVCSRLERQSMLYEHLHSLPFPRLCLERTVTICRKSWSFISPKRSENRS